MKCFLLVLIMASLAMGQATTGQQQSPTASPKTTIFGITLGEPMPTGPKCGHPVGVGSCMGTLGDWVVLGGTVLQGELDGKVEKLQVLFSRAHAIDYCALAREALVDKFGKPSSEVVRKMRTGLGIEIDSVAWEWRLKDATANFDDPAGSIDECFFIISTPKWLEYEKDWNEKHKAKF